MPSAEKGVIGRYASPVGCGGIGVFYFVLLNAAARRPTHSGIHRHILGGIVGALVGELVLRYRMWKASERDTILIHYMELHPEDFQPEERKKFKDILQPWAPYR